MWTMKNITPLVVKPHTPCKVRVARMRQVFTLASLGSALPNEASRKIYIRFGGCNHLFGKPNEADFRAKFNYNLYSIIIIRTIYRIRPDLCVILLHYTNSTPNRFRMIIGVRRYGHISEYL